ncbi:hypothetical protein AAG612_05745 [Citromicrobium bathyomarinum]|uniref:hypothetical protein n=1 Tax=Citromicrobium bathyomarinum TaxID=72174 RepID=UPI00315B2223
MKRICFALLLLSVPVAAQAQYVDSNEPPIYTFTDAEVEAVPMPALAFDAGSVDGDDFEKYFYFHRPDTSFDVAFRDIAECDALTSGLSFYGGASQSMITQQVMQYGMAGAVGGAIGSVVADAIFGSAERRKQRRTNIRNCMFYKGYSRYGLEKDLWQEFNFEEGNSREEAESRAQKLMMQARVASGPKPAQEALQP